MARPLRPLAIALLGPMILSSQLPANSNVRYPTVMERKFTKSGRIEIQLPTLGYVLNQPLTESTLIEGGIEFHTSSKWSFGATIGFFLNSDRDERRCLENFFNDPKELVAEVCAKEGEESKPLYQDGIEVPGANFGPIYLAVRELDFAATAYANWTPIYGKQISFASITTRFDLYTLFGAGLLVSTYYPESTNLRDQTLSRGPIPDDFTSGCPSPTPGVCPSNSNYLSLIGANGRPDPETLFDPIFRLGIGQKLHFGAFGQDCHLKAEVQNLTIASDRLGLESFFILSLGLGLRL